MSNEVTKQIYNACSNYKSRSFEQVNKNQLVTAKMHAAAVVSLPYLNMKLANTAKFMHHPLGSIDAMRRGIASLVKVGLLRELSQFECAEIYGTKSRLFEVL